MNIAIDIDDTLTNSFEYFQPYVAEFFGTTVDYLRTKNISYGNLPPEWKARELEFCRKYYDKTAEFTPFKPYACEAEKISLLIDDMPKNCENAIKRGMRAILFTSPANKGLETHIERACDWKELAGRLLNAERNG